MKIFMVKSKLSIMQQESENDQMPLNYKKYGLNEYYDYY